MEKKTIGTFIAALRKARGMTQRELAERCNVSDKAVSRWERDECAPDLMLLPVLAEIFDITVDELLRGERRGEECADTHYQKEKTEKQMRHLLRKKELAFRDRSWIAKGIAMGGFLAAVICNALNEGLVGFFVAFAFFVAATIAQVCFWNHAVSGLDDFENEALLEYKASVVRVCKNSCLVILLLFAATVPLVTLERFRGLDMAPWFIVYAPMAAATMWLSVSLLWRFVIAKRIEKRGYPASVKPWTKAGKKLLRRVALCICVFGVIAAILISSATWLDRKSTVLRFAEKTYFDTMDEFIAYMEDDSGNIENRDDLIVFPPYGYESGDTPTTVYMTGDIYENKFAPYKKAYVWVGETYKTFYWNNSNVYTYGYGNVEKGVLYIVTHDALYEAYDMTANMQSMLLIALIADLAVGGTMVTLSVISYTKEKKKYSKSSLN